MNRTTFLLTISLATLLTPSSRGCLITLDSHLTTTLLATTECPSWVGSARSPLPTINTHFAFSTGAGQNATIVAARVVTPKRASSTTTPTTDWHALTVAPSAAASARPSTSSDINLDAYPQSFLFTPATFGSAPR